MVTYGARCHSFVLVAQVNHLQNLQTWLKTIAIDLPTAITASDICNNGMELVSTTNVQPRSIVRRHNNRLADSGNSKRYLQQCHGIALKETTPKLAGSTRCHSLGERYRNNGVKSVSRQHEVQSRSTARHQAWSSEMIDLCETRKWKQHQTSTVHRRQKSSTQDQQQHTNNITATKAQRSHQHQQQSSGKQTKQQLGIP
jgi:hypothetical protein